MKLIHQAMENVALEAISFQSPVFGQKIIDCFANILAARSNSEQIQSAPAVGQIQDLVALHTGLNIQLLLDTMMPPAVMVPHINPQSIMLDDWARGMYLDDYNTILAKLERTREKTFIDLKNGRVGGLYSKIVTPIFMSFDYLKEFKFTPREAAAMFMHELGHVFVAYEMSWRQVTTNQILTAVHKSFNDHGLGHEHQVVLVRAGEALGDREGLMELTEIKNKNLISTVVMELAYREAASEIGLSSYDATSFEALADQFAARHGLGRDLVTALTKLDKAYGSPEHSQVTRVTMMFMETLIAFGGPLASIAMTVAGAAVGAGGIAFVGVFLLGISAMTWIFSGENSRDWTYDDVKTRFKRIREQSIELLKNKRLRPEDTKIALGDIAAMDKIIDQLVEYKGVMRTIMNVVVPANRRAVKLIETQRQLEELSANDIFLRAASLRTL